MGDDSAHAKFSPSGIDRDLNCTGNSSLPKQVGVNTDTSAADEGTHFHEYCEKLLLKQKVDKKDYTWNGEVREDFIYFGQLYVDYVESMGGLDYIGVEDRLKFSDSLWGTADLITIKDGLLRVTDIKFGFNAVHPDCSQLKTYAFMAYDAYKAEYNIDRIETVIYQPRLSEEFKVAKHAISKIEIFKERVIATIADIECGEVSFNAGGHCTYCKSKLACPEMQRIREDIGKSPEVMDKKELSILLRELDGFEKYIKEVRAYAYAQALDGVSIPRHKMVRKVTHRKWADGIPVKEIVKYVPKDELFTEKMITPTQALKINKDIPQAFIVKPEGALALVPETDKRSAVLTGDNMGRLVDMMNLT